MKNLKKVPVKEEEVADKAKNPDSDEIKEMKQFIRKKQLENEVLKRLSESFGLKLHSETNKDKSAKSK